jgi:hypothetical protein
VDLGVGLNVLPSFALSIHGNAFDHAVGSRYDRDNDNSEVRGSDRLRVIRELDDPTWIYGLVRPFSSFSVGSLVPVAFDSYARVLHPASGPDGGPVRWDQVAAWSGRTAHALAQFSLLATPKEVPAGPQPFRDPPPEGELPLRELKVLTSILARHTETRDDCFIGIWEGRGWVRALAVETARLAMPERVHSIFAGPLRAVETVGWISPDQRLVRESPSVIWPRDRAWFVATDVDQDSTFVGGSRDLVTELTLHPQLEAWPVSASDPVSYDSDLINGPGAHGRL